MKARLILVLAVALAGCDSTAPECTTDAQCASDQMCARFLCVPRIPSGDAGGSDAGTRMDAGGRDAGSPDAGPRDAGPRDDAAPDAGPTEAGPPDAGLPDAAPDAGPTDAGPICTAALSPPGLTRRDLDYEAVSSQPFGVSTHTHLLIDLSVTTYASIAFRTPDVPFQRRWVFVDAPTSHNQPDRDNPPTMTVSTCPGDFTESALCTATVSGTSTTVWLSTRAEDASTSLFCYLEPGREYYLNFVASDDPLTRSPSCNDLEPYDSRRCAVFFSESVAMLDL